ncbi:MAG: L,D-transpeptidase [Pseudomonadota bacterium]
MPLTKRQLLAGFAAACTAGAGGRAHANIRDYSPAALAYFDGTRQDYGHAYHATNWKKIKPRWRRQLVQYFSTEPAGSVVIDTGNHFLYLVFENRTALRYGVGVGQDGYRWYGRARIDHKVLWPRWDPPPGLRQRHPDLPVSMAPGPDNPLGPRTLYLYRDGVDLGYRLHGTPEPWTIGANVSYGCIRMFPEDIIDLYLRCPLGTRVLVLKHLGAPVIDEAATAHTEPPG